jgi:hypothetical protein
LTLRYQGNAQTAVFEQNVPLDVRFDPDGSSLTRSIVSVGLWLVAGALLSLLLRVSIPNYRRKKALKDRLNEARGAISEISDQVNSQLRVLLRVERLTLERQRHDGWVLGPGFDEAAARVERGLATLERKIDSVQRLDGIACRREALLECAVSPTRVDTIEQSLTAACEALKSDQLSDADWILIQQRLGAADKALNEPTPDEKQAFEALLSKRWKSIRNHFGLVADCNELQVPSTLACMADCFPDGALLPKLEDLDGIDWILSIGAVRADLQLTALEMVRDVQFLAPVLNNSNHTQKWTAALDKLTEWLATPAIANLAMARRLLLQLAEGVSEEEIAAALKNDEAYIDTDPHVVNPNQTVRLTVRFRDPRLNVATARAAIECEWHFHEPRMEGRWNARGKRGRRTDSSQPEPRRNGNGAAQGAMTECGWRVHRCFEPSTAEQVIETRFFWRGQPIVNGNGQPVILTRVVTPREPSQHRQDTWERLLWRPAPQALQLFAALLVPLAALAVTTSGEAASSQWWDLVGLGFGSETIRNILTGQPTPPAT